MVLDKFESTLDIRIGYLGKKSSPLPQKISLSTKPPLLPQHLVCNWHWPYHTLHGTHWYDDGKTGQSSQPPKATDC